MPHELCCLYWLCISDTAPITSIEHVLLGRFGIWQRLLLTSVKVLGKMSAVPVAYRPAFQPTYSLEAQTLHGNQTPLCAAFVHLGFHI